VNTRSHVIVALSWTPLTLRDEDISLVANIEEVTNDHTEAVTMNPPDLPFLPQPKTFELVVRRRDDDRLGRHVSN
jgi:hypothetical protein